jgi:hypothetical protein
MKTPQARAKKDALPNGNWIACVAWVMYGMFLNPSDSSGVLMTPWRLAPPPLPEGWAALWPLGSIRNQFCGNLWKLNLFQSSCV